MSCRILIACLCVTILVCGCKEKRKKEAWQKREQVYTDHPPEHWLEYIQHRDSRVRTKAGPMLVQYGKAQVRPLIEILESTDSLGVRYSVVFTLGDFKADGAPAVPAICKVLMDKNWSKRDIAAEALGKIGPSAREAVPTLLKLLRGDDDRLRGAAARALGRIGVDNRQAVDGLAAALGDEDVNVGAEAADALKRIGPSASAAIPALEKAAKAKNFMLSQAAQEALRSVRGH